MYVCMCLCYTKVHRCGAQLHFQVRQQRGTSLQKNNNGLFPHYRGGARSSSDFRFNRNSHFFNRQDGTNSYFPPNTLSLSLSNMHMATEVKTIQLKSHLLQSPLHAEYTTDGMEIRRGFTVKYVNAHICVCRRFYVHVCRCVGVYVCVSVYLASYVCVILSLCL